MFKSLKTMATYTLDGDELNARMDPVGYGCCVPGGEMRVTVKGDEFSESDIDPLLPLHGDSGVPARDEGEYLGG